MKKSLLGKAGISLALATVISLSSVAPSYAAPVNDVPITVSDSVKKPAINKSSELYKALTKGGFFDYEYYKNSNPDVVNALGSSKSALLNHFLKYGIFEGRQPNADFNVNAYASAYADLRAAYEGKGNEYEAIVNYYNHYVTFGIKENRDITTVEKAGSAGIAVKKAGSQGTEAAAVDSNVRTPVLSYGNHNYYKGLTAEQAAEADAVAKQIADSILANPNYTTDKQRVRAAAWIVSEYAVKCVYEYDANRYYCTPYGVFIAGKYTCAGTTRALGRVLDFMGYSWKHSNENLYTHQWCELYMDGKLGYADGMAGIAVYDEVNLDEDSFGEHMWKLSYVY